MIRDKKLDSQIEFLNQLLTAMDENSIPEEKMKYVDAYLVHLEKEQEARKIKLKWEEEQKNNVTNKELIENVAFPIFLIKR